MNKILRNICIYSSAIILSASLAACSNSSNENSTQDNSNSVSDTRSPEEIQMTSDIFDSLNKMYGYANSGDFDSYIAFWEIDEEVKAQMLENFKAMSELAELKYEVESVSVILLDEGKGNAEVITLNTSKNRTNGSETVIRETMDYLMEKRDDEYHIITFHSRNNEMVSYPGMDEASASENN